MAQVMRMTRGHAAANSVSRARRFFGGCRGATQSTVCPELGGGGERRCSVVGDAKQFLAETEIFF